MLGHIVAKHQHYWKCCSLWIRFVFLVMPNINQSKSKRNWSSSSEVQWNQRNTKDREVVFSASHYPCSCCYKFKLNTSVHKQVKSFLTGTYRRKLSSSTWIPLTSWQHSDLLWKQISSSTGFAPHVLEYHTQPCGMAPQNITHLPSCRWVLS